MELPRIAHHTVFLRFLFAVIISGTLHAQTKQGIVIGNVILKLDGFQDQKREVVAPFEIKIACWTSDASGENSDTVIDVKADENGFFFLEKLKMEGYYRMVLIKLPGDKEVVIPSTIKSPNNYTGKAKLLPLLFSAVKEDTPFDIIDMGTTWFILDKEGRISVKTVSGNNLRMLSAQGLDIKEEDFNFLPLKYFTEHAGSRYPFLIEYLKDRESYAKAYPGYKKAKGDIPDSERENLLKEAIRIYPRFRDAWFLLAETYLREGKSGEAVQLLVDASITFSGNYRISKMLVTQLLRENRYDEAIRYSSRYIEIMDNDMDGYVLLAECYEQRKEKNNAMQAVARGVDHVSSPRKFITAAEFMAKCKENQMALEYYKSYHSLKPEDAWANIYLAVGYMITGDFTMAWKTVDGHPESQVYYYASLNAGSLKQYEMARDFARNALKYYSDGTLSLEEDELKDYVNRTERSVEFEQFWLAYLKKIQAENDFRNWQGPPFDLYVKQR